MKKLKNLSLFLPAYNEESNIEKAVERAMAVLKGVAEDYEVIIVNDGSSDSTRNISERICGKDNRVSLINHEHNKGYGSALRSGFKACKYDMIFFTDADNQFDLSEITKLVDLVDGADIVAGYRLKRSDPFYRLINAWAFNKLIVFLFGINVTDIDCAFKLFKREVIDAIEIESAGAFVSTEIMLKAKNKGFIIKQVGVTHYPRSFGKPTGANPFVVIRAFYEIVKLWNKLK